MITIERVSALSKFELLGELELKVAGEVTDWTGSSSIEVAVIPYTKALELADFHTATARAEVDELGRPIYVTVLVVGPGAAVTLEAGTRYRHFSRVARGAERPVVQHSDFEAV